MVLIHVKEREREREYECHCMRESWKERVM